MSEVTPFYRSYGDGPVKLNGELLPINTPLWKDDNDVICILRNHIHYLVWNPVQGYWEEEDDSEIWE